MSRDRAWGDADEVREGVLVRAAHDGDGVILRVNTYNLARDQYTVVHLSPAEFERLVELGRELLGGPE